MLDRTLYSSRLWVRILSALSLYAVVGVVIWVQAILTNPQCTGTESDHGSAACDAYCRDHKTCNRP